VTFQYEQRFVIMNCDFLHTVILIEMIMVISDSHITAKTCSGFNSRPETEAKDLPRL